MKASDDARHHCPICDRRIHPAGPIHLDRDHRMALGYAAHDCPPEVLEAIDRAHAVARRSEGVD